MPLWSNGALNVFPSSCCGSAAAWTHSTAPRWVGNAIKSVENHEITRLPSYVHVEAKVYAERPCIIVILCAYMEHQMSLRAPRRCKSSPNNCRTSKRHEWTMLRGHAQEDVFHAMQNGSFDWLVDRISRQVLKACVWLSLRAPDDAKRFTNNCWTSEWHVWTMLRGNARENCIHAKRNGSFCLLAQRISRQLDNERGSVWWMLCLCVVGGTLSDSLQWSCFAPSGVVVVTLNAFDYFPKFMLGIVSERAVWSLPRAWWCVSGDMVAHVGRLNGVSIELHACPPFSACSQSGA